MNRIFDGQRVVILGTGPSVDDEQITALWRTRLPVIACNAAYRYVPASLVYACNWQFWAYYMPRSPILRQHADAGECWTFSRDGEVERERVIRRYGLQTLCGKWSVGLCNEPGYLHLWHGTGGEAIQLAHALGAKEKILLGYDLTFGPEYDGKTRKPGAGRHFFGEYPPELQHWTINTGPAGELTGLIELYETIDPESSGIINCTPGSALTWFKTGDWREWVTL